jgi:hypothetical protein
LQRSPARQASDGVPELLPEPTMITRVLLASSAEAVEFRKTFAGAFTARGLAGPEATDGVDTVVTFDETLAEIGCLACERRGLLASGGCALERRGLTGRGVKRFAEFGCICESVGVGETFPALDRRGEMDSSGTEDADFAENEGEEGPVEFELELEFKFELEERVPHPPHTTTPGFKSSLQLAQCSAAACFKVLPQCLQKVASLLTVVLHLAHFKLPSSCSSLAIGRAVDGSILDIPGEGIAPVEAETLFPPEFELFEANCSGLLDLRPGLVASTEADPCEESGVETFDFRNGGVEGRLIARGDSDPTGTSCGFSFSTITAAAIVAIASSSSSQLSNSSGGGGSAFFGTGISSSIVSSAADDRLLLRDSS